MHTVKPTRSHRLKRNAYTDGAKFAPSSSEQFERGHPHNHRCSSIHENENPCEGHFGSGCWIDWLELTICIFATYILHLMVEEKPVFAVRRKAYPDIRGHVVCTF